MSRTICIPSLALNYEDNLLESVGIGGELYYRKQRDWHAIARSHEQTIERMGAENAKLRELVADMYKNMNISCQFSHAIPAGTMAHIKNRAIGLGVEVDE